MASLKETRMAAGRNQTYVGERINKPQDIISGYENGTALPYLEDMLKLEGHFHRRIEWKEDLIPTTKHEVIQALIELTESYPLEAVLSFGLRAIRGDDFEAYIAHYINQAQVEFKEKLVQAE
jgi:transcriptional regulator with XRE-family HTH domain